VRGSDVTLVVAAFPAAASRVTLVVTIFRSSRSSQLRRLRMTKPHHKLKKANHGARPANAKARKAKRKMIKT
jgi:hypothetical protein